MYVCAALLIVTGIAWLVFDTWVRVDGEFGPGHHPVERWLLVAHGVGAYLFLAVLGAMVPVHILMGWRTRRSLWSGFGVAGLCTLLSLSALGLYYAGGDAIRGWTSLIHWTTGLLFIPIIVIHIIMGLRHR